MPSSKSIDLHLAGTYQGRMNRTASTLPFLVSCFFSLLFVAACGGDDTPGADAGGAVDMGTGADGQVVSDGATADMSTIMDGAIGDSAITDASVVDATTADAELDASTPDAEVDASAPLRDGTECTSASECASGNCVDGVCCNAPCTGTCESCLALDTGAENGLCSPVPVGTDPGDECTDEACFSGTCDGARACSVRSSDEQCRPLAGECDVAEYCDGETGDCPSDVLMPAGGSVCTPYRCNGESASCTTSCATHLDCGPRSVCVESSCIVGKRVFVTSMFWTGNLGGAEGADAKCAAAATAAGLSGTFLAWIGTATTSPAARLTHSTVPYYRMDGTTPRIYASNWDDLIDGTPIAIAESEFGTPQADVYVWTGATNAGAAEGHDCNGWTSSAAGTGMAGNASAGPLFSTWYGAAACSTSAHLYCFEQ